MHPMPITDEGGGRLNAFAKEPEVQLVNQETSNSNISRLIIVAGAILVMGLITITLTIN